MKPIMLVLLAALAASPLGAADRKIVLIAGRPSHPSGEHEHRAGMLLLQQGLLGIPGINVVVYALTGTSWLEDETVLDDAAAVIVYSDGGGNGHPFLRDDRLAKIGALVARGVGIGMLHYATEPTIENGQREFLDWIGGAYEIRRSLNPIFVGSYSSLPSHPVTRGVRPFSTRDEWYYYIRFRDGMAGITPILTMVPPLSSINRPDAPRIGDHEGNEAAWAAVRAREPQHTMWVTERADGGRGFGFTGGHYHANWANDDQRKLVLNAILWVAGADVPAGGVASTVTTDLMRANLDPKGGARGGPPPDVDAPAYGMNALLASANSAANVARRALVYAALSPEGDEAMRVVRARELAEVELDRALRRAELFAGMQASPGGFDADGIATLIEGASQ